VCIFVLSFPMTKNMSCNFTDAVRLEPTSSPGDGVSDSGFYSTWLSDGWVGLCTNVGRLVVNMCCCFYRVVGPIIHYTRLLYYTRRVGY
jgi:hypothetical protein